MHTIAHQYLLLYYSFIDEKYQCPDNVLFRGGFGCVFQGMWKNTQVFYIYLYILQGRVRVRVPGHVEEHAGGGEADAP